MDENKEQEIKEVADKLKEWHLNGWVTGYLKKDFNGVVVGLSSNSKGVERTDQTEESRMM
jgi:hypothetical protein